MNELLQQINASLQQIFNLEDPTGRTIVYWIRVLFFVGVGNYLYHIGRIGYNYFCLVYVKNYIKNTHGLGDISSDLLNKLGGSIVIRKGIRLSSIYRRIRDLVNIKQNGGEIDNDVLGDIHAGAASRKAGLSNYILGILIILGLVGTLWGLTTAVINVQPLLQDIDDLDQLPQISLALQETLKGMGTAFKTTLAGLVTSLGLGALGWFFSLLNSAFLTRFETVITTEIVPHFKQTPESAIESSMDQLQVSVDEFKLATEDNVRRMQESIQQLTEKSWDAYLEQQYVIANELSEIPQELRESLGGISEYQVLIRSTVESFEKMTENFMTEVSKNQSAVDTMASDFKELTTQSMSQVSDFKELTTQSMSQVSEYQKALQEGLENAASQLAIESEALKATVRESQESQAKIIEYLVDTLKRRVQSLTDSQQNMQEGLRESVNIIVRDFKDLTTRSMSQVSEYQKALQEGLENTASQLAIESEALKATVRESQESQAKIIEYLVDTLKRRVQSLTDSQQNMQEGLRESVNIIVRDFKGLAEHSMFQVSEYQAALLEGLGNIVSEFKEESAGLKTAIHESQSSQSKFIDELTKNLADTLTNTLEKQLQSMLQPIVENQQDMVEELRETVLDIREIAGELQIRSALERQNEVFKDIKSELIQNQRETGNRLSQLIGELQIIPAIEAQNRVFERIESHLEGQRGLVDEQMEIMQTLDSSVNRLQQTFSKAESDEQQRAENMLQQLTQEFNTLGEKMDVLNHTMGKPGLYRWGSEIRRWFRGSRK